LNYKVIVIDWWTYHVSRNQHLIQDILLGGQYTLVKTLQMLLLADTELKFKTNYLR